MIHNDHVLPLRLTIHVCIGNTYTDILSQANSDRANPEHRMYYFTDNKYLSWVKGEELGHEDHCSASRGLPSDA